MTDHNYYPAGLTSSEREEILSESADREAEIREDCDEGEREPRRCPYCSGGRDFDGRPCPDCDATGYLPPMEVLP